jgi:hypothetical protein
LNLLAGLFIASLPERQTDLATVATWSRDWLVAGANGYQTGDMPDYPPHALILLSPLGLLPHTWAVAIWSILNIGLALGAVILAIRIVRPLSTWSDMALPMLLFLCWGGFRTLLQFSLVTLVFGLLAMWLADRKPAWSGVFLGLSLLKPHVAVPFVLWAIFTRRVKVATVGLSVPIAGLLIFCLRAGANPVAVVQHYAAILGTYYLTNEDMMMEGLAQLRPAITSLATFTDVNVGAILIAVGLFAVTCALGISEGSGRGVVRVGAPPLAGVWSLLTFYHLTYGFILLLPAATLLLFLNDPDTRAFRRTAFWSMQMFLMVDIPGTWRHVAQRFTNDEAAWSPLWAAHADRVLMTALFVCLVVLALQTRATRRPLETGRGAPAGA